MALVMQHCVLANKMPEISVDQVSTSAKCGSTKVEIDRSPPVPQAKQKFFNRVLKKENFISINKIISSRLRLVANLFSKKLVARS
jgi:hypothetical protein